ncbi:MAG: hypothetical protein ACAI44_39130 [Candidatus Sericytochromatia bacterium]
MRKSAQWGLVAASFLLSLTPAAWANNPPGPQMLAFEALIVPMVVLLTAWGGGYALIKKRMSVLPVLAFVGGLVFSLMHQANAAMVALAFGAWGLARGLTMIRWGILANKAEPSAELEKLQAANLAPVEDEELEQLQAEKPAPVHAGRMLTAGILTACLSVLMGGLTGYFVLWFPSTFSIERDFKTFQEKQQAYAEGHKTADGKPRFMQMRQDGSGVLLLDPSDPLEGKALFGRIHLTNYVYTPSFNQAKDGSSFQLWVTPTTFPAFPLNLISPMPAYYTDQTGQVRMVRRVWADQKCPVDAPVASIGMR